MAANRTNQREKEIFERAIELGSPEERLGFIKGACADDAVLLARVRALLQAHDEASRFLPDTPGADLEQTLAVHPSADAAPGDRIGRYKLLEKVGEGGCGVVYVAEQTEPVRRRVALKVIKLGMDTKQVVARFEAERQALAMMDHPNIAKVLDAGTTETGRPYFVMELVRGIRITDYCDQANLSTRDRLDLFIKVCQAIQHAHQKGIIHRDIKPSNILVTLHDGVPVPKVIDFGIAKATEGRLTDATVYTQLHQFIGTPAYMSPEQAEMSGLDIDTRSDIYSLGVLLYELLVGSTPFDAKELMASGIDAMRKTIREKEPVRPSTRLTQELVAASRQSAADSGGENGGALPRRRYGQIQELIHLLRGDLDWIVMKCLEKDRARRYETANGLAADLKRHLNNEPVVARPPSTAYRFQKLVRRNKLAFAAATAVAAALVIGLGAATIMFFRERLARKGEQQQRIEAQSAQKVAETEQQRADAEARKASESQQQSRRLLYASDMNLAQQSLKLNNLGRARRLLDRHRPPPGEEDLRGWEWRYLWQLTRSSALVTLTNRPTGGFSVSFSPDGRRLAAGWQGGRVDLWDVPGRRQIRALSDREYSGSHPGHVAFSPVRNLLAATSEPKVVTLYDLDSGRESTLWRAPDQGEWEVRDLGFSQDGKLVAIYAGSTRELGDAAWVVNVSSAKIESRHPTVYSYPWFFGGARLSPDNRRLYLARSDSLNYRYSIQCVDLATGQELWQTERQRDLGLTALDISPDGRVLVSGSGYEDPTIRVWDSATGRLLARLDGHTSWVSKLAFSKDGRRLVSAANDQSIRVWDTNTWNETQVLRGHTEEVHAIAISEPAQLVASASADGDLILWKDDGKSTPDGYSRLPENLPVSEVMPLDRSHLLLLPPATVQARALSCALPLDYTLSLSLPPGKPPEVVDLTGRPSPGPLPPIGSSTNVLGWFGSNLLCNWNGTNQILVLELRDAEFIQRAAIGVDSGKRPTGLGYNATRQLLAWTEGSSTASVYMANLAAPGRRLELRSDVPGLVPFRFSEDGKYLAALPKRGNSLSTWVVDSLRVWDTETGQTVASIDGSVVDATFARGGRVLVVATAQGNDHEVGFYDLANPNRAPRRVPVRRLCLCLAVSPDGGLVALSIGGGQVLLFDPAKGELIDILHGHSAAFGIAFSVDGRRLIASGGRQAVKLWDVGTRQQLLTLGGTGSRLDVARWSADGDLILAGPPWQTWRAPSWEEIAAAEAKEKTEIKQP